MPLDPVTFAGDLIRCPSITPKDAGALDVLEVALSGLGFSCTRLPFSEDGTADIDNLYAQLGSGKPHLCFAGHTDVVPIGEASNWQHNPFSGAVHEDMLYGRGAADMKGAIAAFVAAVSNHVEAHGHRQGTISLLITGDEEGPAINGTVKMVDWVKAQNIEIDDCLVGEPTNPLNMGDMVKIGRRGSVCGTLTVKGVQGHVAYPHLAANPAPRLVHLLHALDSAKLDDGSAHFQPSNLEITSIDIGNTASNVIPETAQAKFNIRYNDHWNRNSVNDWIEQQLSAANTQFASTQFDSEIAYTLDLIHTGDCFLTQPGAFVDMLVSVIEEVTGRTPELSTSGGTSDARFIKDITRPVEFGLVGQTMHKVDERVAVSDLTQLTDIYTRLLARYFSL